MQRSEAEGYRKGAGTFERDNRDIYMNYEVRPMILSEGLIPEEVGRASGCAKAASVLLCRLTMPHHVMMA